MRLCSASWREPSSHSLAGSSPVGPCRGRSGWCRSRAGVKEGWPAAIDGRQSRWHVDLSLARRITEGPIAWLSYPVILLAGMLVADLLRVWTGEPNMTVQVLLLAIYVLLIFPGQMTARLSHFDPLPVSRRVLFAALVLGCGAGRIAVIALDEPRDLVELAQWEQGYTVRVPARYLEIAWNGRPPTFLDPWRERVEPVPFALFRGSRLGLYCPFPVIAESSPQLFALQIRRAVEAVYGQTIPATEIRERYLDVDGVDVDGDDRVVPRGPGMSLLADHPVATARPSREERDPRP